MNYKLALVFGVLVWMGIAPLYAADTPPTMNGNDTSPTYYTETNTPVIAFPDFTITDAENDDIKGLTISFNSTGHHSDQDNLSYTNNGWGITGVFDKNTGVLKLSGDASPANYQAAVRSITYFNDAAPGALSYDERGFTISFANSDYFSQNGDLANGHFYQFVGSATGFYTSLSAAKAKTYYGLQGYLATVTSAGENTFIKNKIPSSGIESVWLGGSDATTEGSWLWLGGDDTDEKFYDKPNNKSILYTNWYSGEPNDANGGENCLLMYKLNRTAGTWGDGTNTTGLSYIVEYGGTLGDPTFDMTTTTTLNLVAPQPPVINGNEDSPTYNTSDYNPVVVFPNFTVTDTENSDIKGLTIYFSSGYKINQDVLRFTNTSKIIGTFNKTNGELTLSGEASPSEYQAAVRSITYVNDALSFDLIDGSQRQLTISLANDDYLASNGHFYQYVGTGKTWTEARDASAMTSYYGLQGYLSTISSEEENQFVLSQIKGISWLGGSDENEENVWKWVTGPVSERTQFSTGASPYGDSYTKWRSGQPNNQDNQDYLAMDDESSTYPAGEWNDRSNTDSRDYIIEYGGMPGDPTINMTTTTTLNINVVRPEAPGGIVDNLELWLNAEKGFTYSSSTNAEWIDQSRNKMALNVNLIRVPTASTVAPTLAKNSDNFNSTIAFNGTGTGLASAVNAADFDFSEMSVFSVQRVASGTYSHTVWHYDNNGSNDLAFFIDGSSTGNKFNVTVNNTSLGDLASPVLNDNIPHLVGLTSNASSAQIYVDAANVLNAGGQSQLAANGALMIGLDADKTEAQDGDNHLKGNIGEVIMFRKKLSDLDRQKVESYLALKYGITKAQDYLASDGTTSMWTDDSDGYNKDIFGIGRDDDSGLNQKVSKSVNSDAILSVSLDGDFTSSNQDASRTTTNNNDKQFLTLANDGNSTSVQYTEIDPSAFNVRIAREWKVDKTSNFTQNVSLKFEGFDDKWTLYKDNDGDFSSGAVALGKLNANGEITNISLADGDYLTLGRLVKAPGGILTGLRVWFNANSGTTNGGSIVTNGNITSWEGQEVQGANITTVDQIAGAPAVVPDNANFNAVVSFDGNSGIRTSSTAPYTTYFNSTTDDNTIFLVKKSTEGNVEAGYGYDNGGSHDRAGYFERANGYQRADYGHNVTTLAGSTTTIDNKYVIARQDVQPGDLSLYLDDALETQTSTFSSLAGSSNGYLGFGANPYAVTDPSTTNIAEYIIYASDLSATEIKEVQSYLALKYGISLNQAVATDYLASDGTVIWSASGNTGYTTDVFGVGQDDASGLNQKVSRSANNKNGPILATTQDFTSSNFDGSRTGLGDGNFIMMAHNNGTENSFTSSFNGGTNNRSDRVWKVDETGTVGDVYFAIPKTAITFSSGIPVLVISNDLTFDSSDDVVNLADDGTYYWASINPDDGAYLAFATTTPGFTLSKSALTIGENAGTGTFTVVLDAQPSNNVVFNVASDDTNEATVDASTLTFTTANWNTPQTVTVTGVNDNIDRNDNATITVSVDDASSDDYFDALDDQTVAVTLTNDDTAGFTVSETNLTVPENAGTGTFTVVLNTEPTTDVVLNVVSDDTNEATVDQGMLTFTSGDWDAPQTVTVTGVDDAIDRNDNATITVSVNGASSDDTFDTLKDQTVTVALTNDDVSPTVSTTTATSITSTSVVMGGNMSDNGSAAIRETGVVYSSTNTTPAIRGTDVTKDANGAETGVYSKTIGSLTPNTKYYFQAYATSSAGTSYGGVQSFTTKQTQTITFNTLSDKTYGNSDFDPAATASSGLIVTYSSSDASVATIVNGKIHVVAAGSCTIYADQEGDGDYDVAPQVSQNLTIDKATLTATAENKSKTYGEANPTLTLSYSGFVNGEDKTVLTTEPTATTTATVSSAPGTYPITVSGGDADNYTFSYTNGTLTVNKSDQTITFDALADKTYGDADFNLTATSSSGLDVTYSSSNTNVATVSGNTVTIVGAGTTTITASQAGDGNYNAASDVAQTLNVNKATLSVKADDQVRNYGEANPTLTFQYNGFIYNEDEIVLNTDPTATTTATMSSAPGTYPITVSGGDADNYTFSYTNGTLTVNKADQIITFASLTDKTYGDADFSLSATSSSGLAVTYSSSNTNVATVSGSTVTIIGVGSTTITASQAGDGNYNAASDVPQTLTVNKADQTITFASLADKTYGDADFSLSATSSSGLAVTYSSSNTNVATVSGGVVTIVGVGSTTITASQAGDGNYNAASDVPQTLTVNKADQIITFASLTDKTYGDADFSLSATSSSGLAVTYSSSNTNVATVSGGVVTIVGVGSTTITASQAGDGNYNAASHVPQTLTVNKADQTITFASLADKTYGDADFSLSATSSSGLAVTYSSSNTNVATVSGSTVTIIGVGSTTITASQAGDGNYNAASDVPQTLTVNKADQTITFAALTDKTYGDADFSLSATSSSGLAVTYSSSNTNVATVSGSTVTIVGVGSTTITASQAGDGNYNAASHVPQTLTVNKADQTITFALLADKTYGDADFSLSATSSSGLAVTYSSSNTNVATFSGSTVTIVGVGSTTIITSQEGDNNFTAAVPVEQTLTVGKAALSVTADDQSKIYGEVNPTLTVSYSGFVGSDGASDLTTAPTASTTATTTSGAGTYTIAPSGGADNNYTFSYTDGMLTVGKAALIVTADDQSKTYGEANPTLTISYSGFVGSDGASDLSTAPTTSTTATTTSGSGTYPIAVSGGVDNNYTFSYTNGTLTVNKAALSVTADDQGKTYGEANPTLTISYSGFVGSDSESDLTTAPTATTTATTTSGAGTYPITASGGADNNYTFSYTDGTLTVGKKTQAITFNALENRTDKDVDFELNAISSSGLSVIFTSSNESVAICTGTNGSTIKIVGVGDCIIYADQPGNSDYDVAPRVGQPLTVVKYIAGDTNHDSIIDNGEVAGDTNGDGTIGSGEVAGDTNGDGQVTSPEVAGDTNGDGTIDNGEVAGDTNGDGQISSPEVAGDTNGDGTIGSGEIAGDTNGDGTVDNGEVAGDTNGDGTIGSGEVTGDTNGDGTIGSGEVAGDTNGDGTIGNGEVAGDTNGDGTIGSGEVVGDTNGDGTIDNGEVAGDTNGDGTADNGGIAGDTNGNGSIDNGEVAGDTDGNGSIDNGEVAGDTDGDGTIDNGEIAGDTNGDGTIDNGEVAGDTNGDGQITPPEVAGDTNGDGQITPPEIAGDTNGDGTIDNGEVAGDVNGDGTIDNGETQVINPKTDHANIKYLFSPNGDGINDYWKIPNILDLGRVHVKVYDRWGNLMFESTDYQNNWDGTYKGKPVPEGAYIYFIITQKNGTQSGIVNLVR